MSFLNRGQNDAQLVGEGAGFSPSGLIAKWQSSILWSFWTETDPGNLTADGMSPVSYRKMGRGFRLYYASQTESKNAAKAAGVEINPQQMWRLETHKDSILNVAEESLANFGDTTSYEVEIATEKSKKLRHKLHLIALPKSIQAYAKLNGWDVPNVNLDDLTRQAKDESGNEIDPYTDELFVKLCGNPDSPKFVWDCAYGKARAAVWAALGEPDASKWHSKYTYKADGSKAGLVEGDNLSTVSDKLDEALGLIIAPWTAYARVVSVKDPKPDASYENKDGEKKRLTLPVVWEFFNTEKDAKKAAEDELKARAERRAAREGGAVAPATPNGNKPPLPEVWATDEKGFVECVNTYAKKPLPLAAKDLMVEVDELRAWKEYLKL